MAEMIVGAVVTVLIEKLTDELLKLARSEGIHSQLTKWKKTLLIIEDVLADAAQQQIKKKSVESWLHGLQDLAYDMDDVLDDLATEVMKRKLNQESHASTSSGKLLKIIPTSFTSFTPHNIRYGHKMSKKISKITTKLNELIDQKNKLDLISIKGKVKVETSDRVLRLQQTSLLDDESKVLGREGDKEALLRKLLGDADEDDCKQNVSVVSIVGMGGIGKTTLAKLLYNDEKVKDHFKLRAWVCISDEFEVFHISKAIYEVVSGEVKQFTTLDRLHVALKEELSKKRFLVVLDDVWNEDDEQWKLLQSPFLAGPPGSKIIVTTRNTNVASLMNTSHRHNLEVLPTETSLSLLAQSALDEQNFYKYPSLKSIAQYIIMKCSGLPLALTVIGGVLKRKGTSEVEWQKILDSEIWNSEDESRILPALKLSYYDLPVHLKQLFVYCSLFPKDYEFDKNELVLLWLAEGFLSQSKGNKTILESLGQQYFEELQSRSFFQRSTSIYYNSQYTMHDLMHDLAISVAGQFFIMLDDKTNVRDRLVKIFDRFRHFSFNSTLQHEVFREFKEIDRAGYLRTFLHVPVSHWKVLSDFNNVLLELLPRLQCLRVLSVTNSTITEVPQSIGRLKHLRYLNFSKTEIQRVPEEVGDLYNLQSLLVQGCYELTSLPVSIFKLVNLRHLDIGGTPSLKKMPRGIGGLTSLRTLPKVCIEATDGFNISELKDLSDLEGHLSIKGLDKVKDKKQAEDANLDQKMGLVGLKMEWSYTFDDSRKPKIEYEVLDMLRPPTKLTTLEIDSYGGIEFPSWVGDSSFSQLTELVLRGCRNCTHLTRLGPLNLLETLIIARMDEVKTMDFDGISFPSLVFLSIDEMQGLERWSTSDRDNDGTVTLFPRLREISIKSCPKLDEVSVGSVPSLTDLSIISCSVAVSRAIVGMSSSILRLRMEKIQGLTELHGDLLRHLGEIEDLRIQYCDELRYLWESESEACRFLVRLRVLDVTCCKNLVSLAKKEVNVGGNMESLREVTLSCCESLESYSCPNSVERLEIFFCSSMTSLTFSTLHELPSSLNIPDNDFGLLPQFCLKYIRISGCNNFKSLLHEHLQSFTFLEELNITDCPSMDYSFPCGLWPPNLKSLTIGGLNKPMSEWGLQNYPTSLVSLELYGYKSGVVSFAVEEGSNTTAASASTSFLLPPSLTSLSIHYFEGVESLSEVLQHLTCLKELRINSCRNIIDMPETTSSLKVYR